MSCFRGVKAEKAGVMGVVAVVATVGGDKVGGGDAVGERKGGEREERVGERRDMVHGDSGVGDDCVVILSYKMAKINGGRLRYISF